MFLQQHLDNKHSTTCFASPLNELVVVGLVLVSEVVVEVFVEVVIVLFCRCCWRSRRPGLDQF